MTRPLSKRERSERFTDWRWIARRNRRRILGAHDRWTRVARGERVVPFSRASSGAVLYVDRLTGRSGTAFDMTSAAMMESFQGAFRRFVGRMRTLGVSFASWWPEPSGTMAAVQIVPSYQTSIAVRIAPPGDP